MNQINISAKIVAGTNRNKRTKATSTTNLAVDGAPAASSGQPIDASKFVAKDSSVLQTIASPIAVNGAFSATSIAENGVLLSTKYITPAGVDAKINAIINAAPTTLDTLSELATALGNDPNFATTITNLIGTKAPLASPNFSGIPKVDGNAIFHAGNANLPTIDWAAKNFAATGNITANGGNQVWDNSNSPNRFYEGDALVSNVDFATIVGNRSHFNEVGNGSGNTNIPDTYGTLVSFGGSYFGGKLHFPPSVAGYAGLKWMPKHQNYPASWHTIYDTHNANLPSVDWACRNLTANGQIVSSTSTGNINIGSQNSDWIHFYSTLPNFFSQKIRAVDSIGVYGVDNYLHNNGLLLTQGDARIAGVVKSTNQNGSGFTASGWQIGDYSNLNNLDVRSRLQVYEFVQNKINISNGNLIVTDSAKVDSVWFWVDAGSSGTGQHVRYSFTEQHPFKVGDIIRCQSKGKSYIVTVGYIDTNGLFFDAYNAYNNAGVSASAAGDLLIRWDSNDANRKGLLYLNSSDTNAPNFQVVHGGAVKGCFGNCAGLNWQGAPLPANSWGTWIDNGWFNGAVNANSGNIGGWIITNTELSSTGNKIIINSNISSIWVTKPSGGHVMLGQTFINGAWTGKFGISATNANSQELFRLDDEVNRIAGWNFDTLSIHKGLRWGLNGRGVGMYSEGNFSVISAHKDNNNYVALFDNVGMQGFDAVYGGSSIFRITDTQKYIAGWNFDSYHLYSGYMSLNANGSIEHTGGKWSLNNNGSGKLASGNITWDDAGNATFNGVINASGGNFTGNINALSGKIGGFTISDQNLSTVGNVMNLDLNGVNGTISLIGIRGYSQMQVKLGKTFITDRLNTLPTNTFSAEYIKSDDVIFGEHNIGLYAESTVNSVNRTAIRTEGSIIASTSTVGFGVNFVYTKTTPTILSISKGNVFIVSNTTNTDSCYIEMPTIENIRNTLCIDTTSPFQVDIEIVAKYDTPRLFYVGTNNGEYRTYDYNGNFSDFKLYGGDSMKIKIISNGTNTWGQITGVLR